MKIFAVLDSFFHALSDGKLIEEPPVPTQRKRIKCGQLLEAGGTFCDEC